MNSGAWFMRGGGFDVYVRSEIMKLYRSLDQYNRETWVILGKRLLGGQMEDYKEILEDKWYPRTDYFQILKYSSDSYI